MKTTLGIILIVAGLVIIIWGSMGFKTREKVIDVGPIEATKEETHHVPYAPIAGAILAVGGAFLIVAGRR